MGRAKRFAFATHNLGACSTLGWMLPACRSASLQIEGLVSDLAASLARISHARRCIGALSESKLLCNNDLASLGGSPRCQRSVAQTYLVLHPLTAVGWRRVSTAGRRPPMAARLFFGGRAPASGRVGAPPAGFWVR